MDRHPTRPHLQRRPCGRAFLHHRNHNGGPHRSGAAAAFEAMLAEIGGPITTATISRQGPLDRVRPGAPRRSSGLRELPGALPVFEFSGFLAVSRSSHGACSWPSLRLGRLFQLMARMRPAHAGFLNRALVPEGH